MGQRHVGQVSLTSSHALMHASWKTCPQRMPLAWLTNGSRQITHPPSAKSAVSLGNERKGSRFWLGGLTEGAGGEEGGGDALAYTLVYEGNGILEGLLYRSCSCWARAARRSCWRAMRSAFLSSVVRRARSPSDRGGEERMRYAAARA